MDFGLSTFADILQADTSYPYLVDTMGILTAVGKQTEIVKESKRTNMIVIKFEAEWMTLDITLFGGYVEKFKSFFEQQPLEHPIIVIQCVEVKLFQECHVRNASPIKSRDRTSDCIYTEVS
ncbi:unnamed protein product [Cuscuta campestris]|uniref:Replication factor A C-terminal domain-containing protein n=1 Tax=Cuscuta campestris TaxID=132261 RepID=A0A484KJH3_9ASTE|nr:unnamed protein product [Cuscuta campestris]